MTSAQDLLAFIVSGEKSVVILIGLPSAFNIPCFVHLVFWLLCDRDNCFSGPIYLEFCRLPVCLWAFLSLG